MLLNCSVHFIYFLNDIQFNSVISEKQELIIENLEQEKLDTYLSTLFLQ